MYKDGMYKWEGENRSLTTEELINFDDELVNTYPIICIEDPVDENDWEGFKLINETRATQNLNPEGNHALIIFCFKSVKFFWSMVSKAVLRSSSRTTYFSKVCI